MVAPGDPRRALRRPGRLRRRCARSQRGAQFLALGPLAEQYLHAAAAGTQRLASKLAAIALEPAYRRNALVAALERAIAFRRSGAADARDPGGRAEPARPARPTSHSRFELPQVERRPLAACALEAMLMIAPLAPDLEQG